MQSKRIPIPFRYTLIFHNSLDHVPWRVEVKLHRVADVQIKNFLSLLLRLLRFYNKVSYGVFYVPCAFGWGYFFHIFSRLCPTAFLFPLYRAFWLLFPFCNILQAQYYLLPQLCLIFPHAAESAFPMTQCPSSASFSYLSFNFPSSKPISFFNISNNFSAILIWIFSL